MPTGISLKGIKSFGHADLKNEEDKKKFLTNIGAVTLMQLTPGGDYTAGQKRGDCTKEFLTEVANTCPTPGKPFCGGDRCLEVGKYGNTGDPQTGMRFNEGPTPLWIVTLLVTIPACSLPVGRASAAWSATRRTSIEPSLTINTTTWAAFTSSEISGQARLHPRVGCH